MDRFLKRPAGQQPSSAPKVKSQRSATPTTTTTTTNTGSKFAACPICNKSVPITLMSEHMDSPECGAAPPPPPPVPPPAAIPPPPPSQPTSTSQLPSSSANDAFAALRQGAAALKPLSVRWSLAPGPRLSWSHAPSVSSSSAVTTTSEWMCESELRCQPKVRLVLSTTSSAANTASAFLHLHPALLRRLRRLPSWAPRHLHPRPQRLRPQIRAAEECAPMPSRPSHTVRVGVVTAPRTRAATARAVPSWSAACRLSRSRTACRRPCCRRSCGSWPRTQTQSARCR